MNFLCVKILEYYFFGIIMNFYFFGNMYYASMFCEACAYNYEYYA